MCIEKFICDTIRGLCLSCKDSHRTAQTCGSPSWQPENGSVCVNTPQVKFLGLKCLNLHRRMRLEQAALPGALQRPSMTAYMMLQQSLQQTIVNSQGHLRTTMKLLSGGQQQVYWYPA